MTDPSRTVLIIDDNPGVRDTFGQALQEAGYDVVLARDGLEGLACCRRGSIDLVVTDLFMPDMEGVELIRALKREQPGVPIVAISGGGTSGRTPLLDVAKRLGAAWVLDKPIDMAELLRVVRDCLPPASSGGDPGPPS